VRLSLVLFALLCSPAFVVSQSQKPQSPAPESPQSPEAAATANPELTEAEASIAASDWKTASTRLDAYLATHANDARALFDAGYVADHQDQLDRAAGFYRRAVEANPNSFESHLGLGLLLARQGKRDEAHTELSAATTLDPGEAGNQLKARAWRALARLDKPGPDGQGNAGVATNELLEALKLSPETPDDTLMAADLAEDSGNHEAAEAAYRRVLAGDPKSVGANSGLAHVFIVRKQYPDAEKFIRAALQQEPENPVLNAQLATVLAAQNSSDAIPLLQKLHTQHPENVAITTMLADVIAESGDNAGSDKLYTALLATNPNDISLLVAHGQNLVRQQQYAPAYATFNEVTKLDSANADAWSGLAFTASKLHQPSVAIHALTMRSKFLPDVPATYFLWATSYDSLNDRVAAITYYHHFLESSAGKFPDQEWQAKQRLMVLEKKK